MTPLERVEALYQALVAHYQDADDAQLRASAKLLLVAIAGFRRHGGPEWRQLAAEYLRIASDDPERFERILRSNRGEPPDPTPDAGSDWFVP